MHSIPQSLNTLSLHDALPICFRLAGKIVEYMLAGRAMVCYASGIGEDLVDGRDALLLDPYTPETVERQLLRARSEEHMSELQSLRHLVCRLLLEKKKNK